MKQIVFSSLFSLVLLLQGNFISINAEAQDSSTGTKKIKLFAEDSAEYKSQKSQATSQYLKSEAAPPEEVNFKASSIEVLKDTNQVKGTDGVIISGRNIQVQSDTALYNSESKNSELEGNVHVTGDLGKIEADSGSFNLENETGEFVNGSYQVEDGAYTLKSESMKKLSETELELTKSLFSTCDCPDKEMPWRFRSRRCSVTQESYAHCYGTSLEMYDVPILYTPYLGFPVKTERSSGLLIPRIGVSNEDGFLYRQPLYLVIDDYSDMTLTPFTETQTRNGSFLDYRKAFSKRSSINSRFIYSNERPRDGDLRGTNIDGIYNPEIDDNRYGGYYKQRWSTEEDVLVPSSLVLDGRYVSDNLLLKEIDDNDIALQTSRYVTSTGVFRSALGDYFQSELMGEYNQAMLENQDLVFHREPEFIFSGFKSWRPLGYNMFGIKLITRGTLDVTEFKRDEYYQGQRLDFYPNISIPLRYKNYFNSQFDLGANITSYDLSNQTDPNDPAKIWDENPSRTVPNFSYKIGTGIERVYSVDNDSWLRDLTSFGVENQSTQLARVKHVIEPLIKYRYVPEVAQDDIAQFDQLDRIREKSLIVYGITNRFIGRFSPVRGAEDTIPELTPEVEDLPQPQIPSLLDDLGGPRLTDDLAQPLRLKRGQIRELFNVSLLEGYNLLEARENQNPDRNAFTDLTGNITVNPTEYAGLGFTSTYDREHSKFSSWEATSRFRTDRGDSLLARYSFVAKEANSLAIKDISQLQGGAELVLSDRVRFGYFTRFDSPSGAFIDSIAALRLISACNCWHLDLEYVLQTNPDREKYLLSFTFGGLGSLTQAIPYTGYRQDSNQNTN